MKVLTTTEIMIDLLKDEIEYINYRIRLLNQGYATPFDKSEALVECGKMPSIRLIEHFRKASFENTVESLSILRLRRRLCRNLIIQLTVEMSAFDIAVNSYKNQIIINGDVYTVDNDADNIFVITKKHRNYIYVITDNMFKVRSLVNEVFEDEVLIESLKWQVVELFH